MTPQDDQFRYNRRRMPTTRHPPETSIRPDRRSGDQMNLVSTVWKCGSCHPHRVTPPTSWAAWPLTNRRGLHLGHARTFLVAWLAARSVRGKVLLRVEDLDSSRTRPEAKAGLFVDLKWLGLDWDEGPDRGGPNAPYTQSERLETYTSVLGQLKQANLILSVHLYASRYPQSRVRPPFRR